MNIANLITGKPKRIRIIARTLFHILSAVISTIEKIGLDGKRSTLTRQLVNGKRHQKRVPLQANLYTQTSQYFLPNSRSKLYKNWFRHTELT